MPHGTALGLQAAAAAAGTAVEGKFRARIQSINSTNLVEEVKISPILLQEVRGLTTQWGAQARPTC